MGNCGTGVWPKFLKPTPVIYLVIEKIDPFIYLTDQNIDPFIYYPLIFIPIQGEKQQQQQQQTNIIIKVSNNFTSITPITPEKMGH